MESSRNHEERLKKEQEQVKLDEQNAKVIDAIMKEVSNADEKDMDDDIGDEEGGASAKLINQTDFASNKTYLEDEVYDSSRHSQRQFTNQDAPMQEEEQKANEAEQAMLQSKHLGGQLKIEDLVEVGDKKGRNSPISVNEPAISDVASSLDDFQRQSDMSESQTVNELNLPPIWNDVTHLYKLLSYIGEGSYGTVIKGYCRNTETPVAIKLVQNFTKYEYDCVKLIREVQIMKHLNKLQEQQNYFFTPQLLDIIVPKGQNDSNIESLFLVQTAFGTDLKKLIELSPKSNLNEKHVTIILYNLLCALKFMHSANVIHRDIKPSNILINEQCQIRICDFGLARTLPQSCQGQGSGNSKRIRDAILKFKIKDGFNEQKIRDQISQILVSRRQQQQQKKRSMSNHIGSRWYRAPEICLLEKQYDSASDIWSLGCSVAELVRGVTFSQNFAADTKFSTRLMALFPGDSCYPISPKYQQADQKDIVSPNDQLILILKELREMINEQDMSFITTDDPRRYAEHLQKDVKDKGISQSGRGTLSNVKGMSQEILTVLQNMIKFNPYFRTSASETLYQDVFESIRVKLLEKSAPDKILLAVDEDNAFDYENCKSFKFNKADYIDIILKEAKQSHQARLRLLKQHKKDASAKATSSASVTAAEGKQ